MNTKVYTRRVFSKRARKCIAEQGYSVKVFCDSIGVSTEVVYDTQKSMSVGSDYVFLVAKALKVSADYLIGLTDDPTPYWRSVSENASC